MSITSGDNYWVLESGGAAYALGVEPLGVLTHTHWGPKLPRLADYPKAARPAFQILEHEMQNLPQEATTGEAGDSNERTIDGISADGSLRGFVLRFDKAEPVTNGIDIDLIDTAQSVRVTLKYRTLDRFGLFSRSLSIRNEGERPITLDRVFSGTFHLPQLGDFALNSLNGRWADEFGKVRQPMAFGTFARESRRLTTSHRSMPFFAVDREVPGLRASEENGEVWFGALDWSGNWKMLAERTRDDRSMIHLGLNDHDFAWDLQPGGIFDTPRAIFGYTAAGFGAMSRAFHDYVREEVAPRRHYQPPVVYNSWCATTFKVEEDKQIALASQAAAIGCELFVLDDGWFSGRSGDDAGLGDWWPDPAKFPNGLSPLIDAVHNLGMKFGLWIEPEMVNPNSELYRAHPDWIIHFPRRERTLSRNELILNLGRLDVQDHLIDVLDTLLTNAAVDFVKWDMNRNVSEPGWPDHVGDQRELWVRYVEGVHRVWSELRRRHPDIIFEGCSGGGGRVDLAMMVLTEQTWISDNTTPPARLEIQEGYSQLFPAGTMAAWVTDRIKGDFLDHDNGDYSLDYRFHAAMAGALGIGGNLLEWSEEQRDTAARHIASYKILRPLIANGDLFRILSPHETPYSAFMYVAKDKSEAALFAFRTHVSRMGAKPRIRLPGLEADAVYRIEDTGVELSGRALGVVGIDLIMNNFESILWRVTRTG